MCGNWSFSNWKTVNLFFSSSFENVIDYEIFNGLKNIAIVFPKKSLSLISAYIGILPCFQKPVFAKVKDVSLQIPGKAAQLISKR